MTAAKNKVAKIMAVSPKRDYVMSPENKQWPDQDKIRETFDDEENKIIDMLNFRIDSGKITERIADMVQLDLIWKKVAKRLGMTYIVIRRMEQNGR